MTRVRHPSSLAFHNFDFFSTKAEQNWTKLHRMQDLNVLYQACVFQSNQKIKITTLASDWLRHFQLLLSNNITELNQTLQEARTQHPLPSLCFRVDQKTKMAALAYDWVRHFLLLLCNHWTEFNETLQEARSLSPLPSFCFSVWSKTKNDGGVCLWLVETVFTSLQPFNRI